MVAINRKAKSVKLTSDEAVAVVAAVVMATNAAPPPEEVFDLLESVLDKLADKFSITECDGCGGFHAAE